MRSERLLIAILAVLAVGGVVGCVWALVRLRQRNKELAANNNKVAWLERQLRTNRRIVGAVADGLSVALLICDQKGTISFANRAATELFRIPDMERRSLTSIALSAEVNQLLQDAIDAEGQVETELTLRLPDEVSAIIQIWPDKNDPNRLFVSLYDISRLRHLERVRQDFVANVSHELRTPLTTIRALTETLSDSPQDELIELGANYLPRIIGEVDRLTAITTDLLTLAHAETTPVTKEAVSLDQVVRQVVEQTRSLASSKALELTSEVEPCMVSANQDQLTQVLINLVENAIKYTVRGSVQVRLTAVEGMARLTVRDTGIGIPQEDQTRVFERFYRVDKGRSRDSGGTGLGLSIVKHIVEQHGGHVAVDSILGLGSTFRVELPLHSDAQPHSPHQSLT
ncbi:MAG: hypothetical protein JNJ45_05230 [Chthonomonas sp.]|nr:hypothetical protein [Chthonomonas sp.]